MKTYNALPNEDAAQASFARFCNSQPSCEKCPLNKATKMEGSDNLAPGGVAERSCAIHWLYSRWMGDHSRICAYDDGKQKSNGNV